MPPPPPPNPTQSTDIKVNEVTPALFARAPDAASMALVPVAEAQAFIRVLGLAPTKAKNLVAMSKVRVRGRSRQRAGLYPRAHSNCLSAVCCRRSEGEGQVHSARSRWSYDVLLLSSTIQMLVKLHHREECKYENLVHTFLPSTDAGGAARWQCSRHF